MKIIFCFFKHIFVAGTWLCTYFIPMSVQGNGKETKKTLENFKKHIVLVCHKRFFHYLCEAK